MLHRLLWGAALSLPLSALLATALQQRYHCTGWARLAFFALEFYLALIFFGAWTPPKPGAAPGPHFRLAQYSAPPGAAGIVLNLLLLLPFSLLTPLMLPGRRTLTAQLLTALLLSLLIETGQVLGQRRTSLYDPLLQLSGSVLGCGLSSALRRRFPRACAGLEVRGAQCLLTASVLGALTIYCLAFALFPAALTP